MDAVDDESNTENNCSTSFKITVSRKTDPTEPRSLGKCEARMVVKPNEECTLTNGVFRNIGGGCFNYTPFGSGRFCSASFNLNGFQGTRVGDDFRIDVVP